MSVLKNSIQLGIYFMLMFTSYTSFSTIISQLYKQQGYTNLGKYSIFTNYGCFMISNMFAPYIGARVNSKWLMMLAGCCYSFNYFTGFLITYVVEYEWAVYAIVVGGAAIGGLSASILWVSQGDYMHTICEQGNKQKQKGYYFGVFFRLYSSSNILAGVATTFLLGFLSSRMYFLIITLIGMGSVLYMLVFLEKVDRNQNSTESKMERRSLLTQSGSEDIVSRKSIQFDPWAVFKFYPRMLLMLSFIGVVGFVIGYYTTSLSSLIQETLPHDSTHQYIRLRSGIGIICLGVGEIFGGYISGHNADRMGIKTIGGIAVSIYLITCQLSTLTDSTKNQIIAYVASFGWGLTHSYFQNWITIVCSRNYEGRLQSFSISKQFHCLTLCIYQLILIFGNPSMGLILTGMTFLTAICILPLTQLKEKAPVREVEIIS